MFPVYGRYLKPYLCRFSCLIIIGYLYIVVLAVFMVYMYSQRVFCMGVCQCIVFTDAFDIKCRYWFPGSGINLISSFLLAVFRPILISCKWGLQRLAGWGHNRCYYGREDAYGVMLAYIVIFIYLWLWFGRSSWNISWAIDFIYLPLSLCWLWIVFH